MFRYSEQFGSREFSRILNQSYSKGVPCVWSVKIQKPISVICDKINLRQVFQKPGWRVNNLFILLFYLLLLLIYSIFWCSDIFFFLFTHQIETTVKLTMSGHLFSSDEILGYRIIFHWNDFELNRREHRKMIIFIFFYRHLFERFLNKSTEKVDQYLRNNKS